MTLAVIVLGLVILVKSAEVFVDQASALAKKLKMSDFLIGLTIVSLGTTLPELMSTIFSAVGGYNGLVVSNIIGSNITNLCLILGIVAIFNNYRIKKRDVDINVPLNLAAIMTFWALAVFMEFWLNWAAGVSLVLIFAVLMLLSKDYNRVEKSEVKYADFKPILLIGSLGLVVLGGKLCVGQIVALAAELKVSETILGYFLLAVGTSIPELATTWVAVRKHNDELGIGNILGANLCNLMLATGVATFIRPVDLADFKYDLMFLTGATLATYVFAVMGKKYAFSKKEGLGLLLIYGLFVVYRIGKG